MPSPRQFLKSDFIVLYRTMHVIARRAKPDVAISRKFPECIVSGFCADL